jgi:UDP-N-acetylmuramate--alanine ligase
MGIVNELFRGTWFSGQKGRGFRIITKDTFVLQLQEHMERPQLQVFWDIFYMRADRCYCIIGGIVENYNSNLIGDGKTVTVVEADEFDRSFSFASNIACITSMDADHLDIYGTMLSNRHHFRIGQSRR